MITGTVHDHGQNFGTQQDIAAPADFGGFWHPRRARGSFVRLFWLHW